jgi:hypothetical protein
LEAIGALGLGSYKMPLCILLLLPERVILAPIGTSSTPKVKEDDKILARMAFKVVNHKSHILARN